MGQGALAAAVALTAWLVLETAAAESADWASRAMIALNRMAMDAPSDSGLGLSCQVSGLIAASTTWATCWSLKTGLAQRRYRSCVSENYPDAALRFGLDGTHPPGASSTAWCIE